MTITLPNRKQFNSDTKKIIEELFEYYDKAGRDFGTRGEFENRYKEEIKKQFEAHDCFVELTVSGTVALHVILQSLDLEEGDEVLVPPITDPGAITPILLNHLKVRVYDLDVNGETTLKKIQERVTLKTKAVILNHLSGVPVADVQTICDWCKENSIASIEDASQAHGARIGTNFTGTFGDVNFYSTMFSKNHSSGGVGGIILTKNKKIYEKLVLTIHKGKALFEEGFNEKNPASFQGLALNLELPEICSAIGLSTIKNLKKTNFLRNQFLIELSKYFKDSRSEWSVWNVGTENAPYFGILKIPAHLLFHKGQLIEKINSAGVKINGHYPYVATEWPWMSPHLDGFSPNNAIQFRDSTINLLFNENFDKKIAQTIFEILRDLELNFN